MDIIISENGKNAERVHSSLFDNEDKLQKLIHDNPNTIPIYEIDEDTQLFVAAREFQTNSGPIDALAFDAKGNIYVIETKLQKNPDKRYVVAQALDYGASLWRHSTDFNYFVEMLDVKTNENFDMKFEEKFNDFFSEAAIPEFMDEIKNNLSNGIIKFVVLMDELHDNLKDLVLYVNQNSKFDIYAVEMKYYKHKTFEILIPKIYGAEVKKDIPSTSTKKTPWQSISADEFWDYVTVSLESRLINAKAFETIKALAKVYEEITKKINGNISYWRVFLSDKTITRVNYNDANNKVFVYMGSDGEIVSWRFNKTGQHIDFVNGVLNELIQKKIFDKENWTLGEPYAWYPVILNKPKVTPEDLEEFLQINKRQLKKNLSE